jgi:hypothetical protein
MNFSRTFLRGVCGLLISLVLLTQTATASYVCPNLSLPSENDVVSLHDCLPGSAEVAQTENLNLCRASCSELEPVSQELAAHVSQVAVSPWSYPVHVAVQTVASTSLESPTLNIPEPALSVLFCCFRN